MLNDSSKTTTTAFSLLSEELLLPRHNAAHVAVFRILRAIGDAEQRVRFKFTDASVLVLHTEINAAEGNVSLEFDDQGGAMAQIKPIHATAGWRLMILQPFDTGVDNSVLAMRRANEIAAAFMIVKGRNAAWDLLFDYVDRRDGGFEGASSVTLNPMAFPEVDVSPNGLTAMGRVVNFLRECDQEQAERLNRSFYWYGKAITALDGVDALISMWVAWEALAFDHTNVAPLTRALSEIYEIDYKLAQNRYLIGRIHGLRSNILHKGRQHVVHSALLDYMSAVYIDVLLYKLTLPAENRVETLLATTGFDLLSLLKF